MGSPTRARGYVPLEGMHSLIVEIAPALAIHRVIDLALKSVPEAEPGMLYVERQFGILELHDRWTSIASKSAGEAVLDGIGARPADQLKPQVLYTDIVDEVTDQHAVILNRNREASMILPGECLLARGDGAGAVRRLRGQRGGERGARRLTLVDCQMIGASGRLFIAGERADLERAGHCITKVLAGLPGRS